MTGVQTCALPIYATVRETRAALEKDAAAARTGLEAESEKLAAAVVQAILKPAAGAPAAGGRL